MIEKKNSEKRSKFEEKNISFSPYLTTTFIKTDIYIDIISYLVSFV